MRRTSAMRAASSGSHYPLPYPPAYPPIRGPGPPPPARRWTPDLPHRYAVCRNCSTILIVLPAIPPGATVLRHFTDENPLSIVQLVPAVQPEPTSNHIVRRDSTDNTNKTKNNVSFVNSATDPGVHMSPALAWLRHPFVGFLSYDASNDTDQSVIPLACRNCRQSLASLLLLYGSRRHDRDEQENMARLSFTKWAISLADAYGREIEATPELLGFWKSTPAPFAARPWPPYPI